MDNSLGDAKACIFCATEAEREKIVRVALERANLCGRKDIWICVTGVGKVNATFSATMAVANTSPTTAYVNVGVCGGNAVAAAEYPCVSITRVVNNDFDTGAVCGYPFIKPSIDLPKGDGCFKCFTQDKFATSLSEVSTSLCTEFDEVRKEIEVVGEPLEQGVPWYVDMELYGIAMVCRIVGSNLTAIKSVSDVVGSTNQASDYGGSGFDAACNRAAEALSNWLTETGIFSV